MHVLLCNKNTNQGKAAVCRPTVV